MKRLRLTTLFSGYDSQALAMERLKRDFPGFDYELVAWCEIDSYAVAAHCALFPRWADRNVGDITKADFASMPDTDVATWSFPCQDISAAGRQKGFSSDSGTRAKRPKFLLMENVKALVQKKFMPDFLRLQRELQDMGYANYWQVLNSKDYGVPQNRERVFMVSILRDFAFEFPKPFPLEKRLRDILEENVDESYYLKDEQVRYILAHCFRKQNDDQFLQNSLINEVKSAKCFNNDNIMASPPNIALFCPSESTETDAPRVMCVASARPERSWHGTVKNQDRIYDPLGISPTLHCCEGGNLEPKIIEQCGCYDNQFGEFAREPLNGVARTLKEEHHNAVMVRCSIRKLTPTECLRLMGVDDSDIEKMKSAKLTQNLKNGKVKERPMPKTQLYKMAGNSIVVDVLYHIFHSMFIAKSPKATPRQLSLFD